MLVKLIGVQFIGPTEDVNSAYNSFTSIIQSAYKNAFPLKKVSKKRSRDKLRITSALKRVLILKIHCIEGGSKQEIGTMRKNTRIIEQHLER